MYRPAHARTAPPHASAAALALLAALGLACTVTPNRARADDERRVIHEQPGMFGEILVEEDDAGVRFLLFAEDGDSQSAYVPGHPEKLLFQYTQLSMAALALVPEPKRVMIVGLGGGSMPMFLRHHFPALAVDAVEIDPAVAAVARRFFGYREDELRKTHLVDGRAFVEAAKPGSYDLVFLDAFGSDDIPMHLATVEFLHAVRRALSPKGLVVSNVLADSRHYHRMVATYAEVFPTVRVIAAGDDVVNRIVLGGELLPGKDATFAAVRKLETDHRFAFSPARMVSKGWEPEGGARKKVEPLRDAKTPVKPATPARPAASAPPPSDGR